MLQIARTIWILSAPVSCCTRFVWLLPTKHLANPVILR